jgi:hypothetical protein
MKLRTLSLALTLALAQDIYAQPQIGSYSPPVVNPRPVVSPYLNLNRGGSPPAINYYGIVRPQIENHQAIQGLQQQVQTTQTQLQNQTGAMANEEMAPTGRAVGGYLNYTHYFPLFSRGAGGSGGARR